MAAEGSELSVICHSRPRLGCNVKLMAVLANNRNRLTHALVGNGIPRALPFRWGGGGMAGAQIPMVAKLTSEAYLVFVHAMK
eukprot:3718422-Alexandrium_andersonii.AAC.1